MMLKVNSNTEDHTLYTCRTVPTGHIRKEYPATFQACQNSVVGADNCPTVLWVPSTTAIPDEHGKTLACLWASAIWQAPTPAIPEEDGANLPHASDINHVSGAYNRLIPYGVGNKT